MSLGILSAAMHPGLLDQRLGRPPGRIVLLARWPAPGRCKRRLAASCGSSQRAAAIQARLTSHTLAAAAAAAAACGAQLLLAVDGLGGGARRRWQRSLRGQSSWPPSCRLQVGGQGGGSLGCRMQRQLQRGFATGAERVVLIGSDLPSLEIGDLCRALTLLHEAPLVLGPAADGGYWLIGMNRAGFALAGARLMSGISWGGSEVLAQTLTRAGRLQLPARLLRQQRDLDDHSDLAAWLRPGVGPGQPPRRESWR